MCKKFQKQDEAKPPKYFRCNGYLSKYAEERSSTSIPKQGHNPCPYVIPGGQLALLDLLPILFVGGDLAGNQLSPAGPAWLLSGSPWIMSNWL